MRKPGFGDIVSMPLPTDWTPDLGSPPGVPPAFASLFAPGYAPVITPVGEVPPVSGSVPNLTGDSTQAALYNALANSYARGGPSTPVAPIGPFARESILPDEVLPPALRRTSPYLQQPGTLYHPNHWDAKILSEAMLWRWISDHGGLKTCCRIPELGSPVYDIPPWEEAPSTSRQLNEMYSQPLTAFQTTGSFNGLDVVVGQFRVPIGWDGVINKVVFGFTGTGFDDFSGNIIWRIKVGSRYVKNLGNVMNAFGSLQTAYLIPGQNTMRIISGQTVSVIANVPSTSPISGGVIVGGVFGWTYPRK
jgi:hypothetical protein